MLAYLIRLKKNKSSEVEITSKVCQHAVDEETKEKPISIGLMIYSIVISNLTRKKSTVVLLFREN